MIKRIVFMLVIVVAVSCTNNKKSLSNQSEQGVDSTFIETEYVAESKLLYDTLFFLIEKNNAGVMKDDEFKPKADLVKQKIDSTDSLMDEYDKSVVKEYGNKLLDNLSKKLSE